MIRHRDVAGRAFTHRLPADGRPGRAGGDSPLRARSFLFEERSLGK